MDSYNFLMKFNYVHFITYLEQECKYMKDHNRAHNRK